MKRVVLLTVSALLVTSLAYGQTQFDVGSLDIYGDLGANTCNVVDTGGIFSIYVFSTHANDGTTACQFKVGLGPGVAWMRLSESSPFPTVIGNAATDVSVAYGACITGDNHILTVQYFGSNAPACSYVQIQPADGITSGMVEIVDCAVVGRDRKRFPAGGSAFINNDGSCNCVDPVAETTWGGIKALYN